MDNTFVAKKMGEVLAFCNVGADTFELGRAALSEKYGADFVQTRESKFKSSAELLTRLFMNDAMRETGLTKANATGEKLTKLRDIYVGDEWDNAVELSEWSGFFEGAGRVHWELVRGVATSLKNDELASLADNWIEDHKSFLDLASATLKTVGTERAAL